jgi:hypothetical protein
VDCRITDNACCARLLQTTVSVWNLYRVASISYEANGKENFVPTSSSDHFGIWLDQFWTCFATLASVQNVWMNSLFSWCKYVTSSKEDVQPGNGGNIVAKMSFLSLGNYWMPNGSKRFVSEFFPFYRYWKNEDNTKEYMHFRNYYYGRFIWCLPRLCCQKDILNSPTEKIINKLKRQSLDDLKVKEIYKAILLRRKVLTKTTIARWFNELGCKLGFEINCK